MTTQRHTTDIDGLLDQAGDAVARNDWKLAKKLAEDVLRHARHPEAALVLRTANAFLETEHSHDDPLSTSRDLRFVSIMFCDIVGSTRLARDLGDAHWRNTLERFRRRCARAVRRYDGYIHEASGDELLILFGYPRVREDDARRAVLAGLDIVAAVASFSDLLKQEHGVDFRVRVGVHTGRALISDRSKAEGAEIGDGLVGDAANIAKRVETAAAPNTVWVSEATRQIVEGFFHFADTPDGEAELDLGGRVRVIACEVTGRTAAVNRHQVARVRSDEMVGRREECQKLLNLWERAKRSGAPFVVVTGRAGIGKSRLVEFLAETAAGNRANRLECICTEMLKPVAFAPLIGVLERFANIRQADSSEVRLAKLDSSFSELAAEFKEFVPYLAWMMSIPSPGRDIVELQPEVIRERIFDSLMKVLKLAASIRPSVLWIEDLQWADHSTQEFCQRLEAHGPMPGLLVVATMRIDYAGSRSPVPWSDVRPSTDSLVTVELGPLSADESRQLISARSGLPADAPVAQTIVESTGGNPLYIEEVVRSVLAGRVSRQDTGTLESQLLVPESLQPIFAQLVDRLEGDRHIAQMASLLGRDLPEPLTRTVIARILSVTEDEVVGSFARLIEAEIVEPILTELSHGYRFRHDLIREALVHSVGPDAASNHGRIAKVIEQLFSDYARERPELLAYHFAKADLHERAAEYWLTAGIGLQGRAAHQEAIASFDRGLESLTRVVQPTDNTANARLELSLRAGRGVSVQTTKGYTNEKAGTDWARAYALSKMIGAEGALVPALGGLWSFHFVRGANTFIRDLGATSVNVAEQILLAAGENPAGQVIGYACLAYALYFHGELTEGRQSAERSWEVYDKVKDRGLYLHVPQDPGLAGLSFLGPVRWSLGDQLGAARAVETATALGSALESKRAINLARIGQTNAWLHQIRRDYQQALSAADQALTVALEFHVDWAVVNLLLHKGLALAHLNAQGTGFADAVALVRQNLGYWRAGGAETMVPYFLGQLAEAHHLAGEHREALDLIDQAIALSETVDEHCHTAELYRVRGQTRLALFGSETRSGIDDLIDAAEKARRQRAVSFEIRSIVSLLTAVPELLDRERWIGRLEDAIGDLASSENGQDERRGRALIAETRKNNRGRRSQEFK